MGTAVAIFVVSCLCLSAWGFSRGLHRKPITRREKIAAAMRADGLNDRQVRHAFRLLDSGRMDELKRYVVGVVEARAEPSLGARDWTKADAYRELL